MTDIKPQWTAVDQRTLYHPNYGTLVQASTSGQLAANLVDQLNATPQNLYQMQDVAVYLSYLQTGIRDTLQERWVEDGSNPDDHPENVLTEAWGQGHLEWVRDVQYPLACFADELRRLEPDGSPLTESEFCYQVLETAGAAVAKFVLTETWESEIQIRGVGQQAIVDALLAEYPPQQQEDLQELIHSKLGVTAKRPPPPGSEDWLAQYTTATPFKYHLGQTVYYCVDRFPADLLMGSKVKAALGGIAAAITADQGVMLNDTNYYQLEGGEWVAEQHLHPTVAKATANRIKDEDVLNGDFLKHYRPA